MIFTMIFTSHIYGMQVRYMEPDEAQKQEAIIEQQAAPVAIQQQVSKIVTKEQAKKVAQQKKAMKAVASFIASKKLIKKLHGFFMRSAKPSKKLLQSFFFYCDFHKAQLVKIQECTREFTQLAHKTIPVSVRVGSYALTSQEIKNVMEDLVEKGTIKGVDIDSLHIPIDEQLAQDDPILYAQAQELNKQWEQFTQKWEGFFTALAPYVQARTQLHEQALQNNLKSFAISMFFRNFGPALGLGIEGGWKISKLKNLDDQEVLIDLAKQVYDSAVVNKTVLENTIIACAQESIAVYGTVVDQVIKEAFKRTK